MLVYQRQARRCFITVRWLPVSSLYQVIETRVRQWRDAGYPCPDFPAISEILQYQIEPGSGASRFLRGPQIRALETYWYLRLIEKTPHIMDLYKTLYPKQTDFLSAMGLTHSDLKDYAMDYGREQLLDRIKTDPEFVTKYKLEAVRETLTLDYPSYIFALAMGAGKTILIGAIIATEFCMAIEYPDDSQEGRHPFIENALVFAPGKTIIESLRELLRTPFDKFIPPRLYKQFAATVKITFTRDGDPSIPVVLGSSFNIVVTNTEKIRIQKEAIRKSDIGRILPFGKQDEAFQQIANLRLQTIASLPNLGIFSDEAHHTYGQTMGQELKRVRQTVDYLHENTGVVCVVNTTGTPYFERQALKDVVIWYGLAEGIRDGILKEVADSILGFSFDPSQTHEFIHEVVTDFFREYGDVRLSDGSPARLAIYFPQTDDLEEMKPFVEAALAEVGQTPAIVLRNTSESNQDEIDAFNRLSDPASPHRVILLVNKGTEGWNCPSLFACALARKLKSSNNFVLQAASRCLRQVPGNRHKARIYLSSDNRAILDRQLQETYGATIDELNHANREFMSRQLVLHKLTIPPLSVTQVVRTVVGATDEPIERLSLKRPALAKSGALTKAIYTLSDQDSIDSVLRQVSDTVTIETSVQTMDLYTAATKLAGLYRINMWLVYDELKRMYSEDAEVPLTHLEDLARQIEGQTRGYIVREEKVEVALAIVKPDGFKKQTVDGNEVYTAEIVFQKERQNLLLEADRVRENINGFGFHYAPYNFDSHPEISFFEQMLAHLNIHPDDIEDMYFTGALTDPDKTDFFVEYKDEAGKWRRYTPDFVIRRKDENGKPGESLIVEIKSERERTHPIDGEHGLKAMALRKWQDLDPGRLKYELIFAKAEDIMFDQLRVARRFVEGEEL